MATRKTSDALRILHARYIDGNPEAQRALESAREQLRLSMQLHDLRKREGLTQKQVAERAGTKRTVIARLEQPGYEKHTISTLHRVAHALGYEVKVTFVPIVARRTGGAANTSKAVSVGPRSVGKRAKSMGKPKSAV